MKRRDYIPYIDAEFDSFQKNLVKQVTEHKAEWKINLQKLEALYPLQEKWDDIWKVAKVRVNLSPAVTATKDQRRNSYIKSLRYFIHSDIYYNRAMKEGDIILCGLKPYDPNKKEEPEPQVVPVIVIKNEIGTWLKVYYYFFKEDNGKLHRGKPSRSYFLEFRYSIGSKPSSPDDCTHKKIISKAPLFIPNPLAQRGQKLWFYARWQNRRGLTGPWTEPDSVVM